MHPVGPRSRRARHVFVRRDPIVRTQTSTRAGKLGELAVLLRSDRSERLADDSDGASRERAEPDVSRGSVDVVLQHRGRVRSVGYVIRLYTIKCATSETTRSRPEKRLRDRSANSKIRVRNVVWSPSNVSRRIAIIPLDDFEPFDGRVTPKYRVFH